MGLLVVQFGGVPLAIVAEERPLANWLRRRLRSGRGLTT